MSNGIEICSISYIAFPYVSVLTEYGIDSYAVTNQGSGYDWGEVPYTMKDLYPDSYIGSQSAYAYNNALEIYGLWPWGNV